MRGLVLFLLVLPGCPNQETSPADATPVPDQGLVVSEAGLALCDEPNAYCTPADPCGLNPSCSAQGLCLTQGSRDCNDGIPCTGDRCVHGGCAHSVVDGYCLIDELCFKNGATLKCGRCSPEVSKTRWSPLDGVSCDDQNLCTKGDGCKQGMCVGQLYSCNDLLSCTTDFCDGLGGCNQLLDTNYCLIEKQCYPNGETDLTGCDVCDVSVSQSSWQPRANVCQISGMCYAAGVKDPTGCFTCEPLHSPNSWTPLPDRCLISQVCLQKGSLHPSGCATCDPLKSTKKWSPLGSAKSAVTEFSAGMEGYSTTKPTGNVGWQLSGTRFTSPPGSLYYGDLATGNYDSGSTNSGTATTAAMTLQAGQKAYLSFQLYLDTETSSNFDVLSVKVSGQVLWNKATNMNLADYKKWINVTVDLSAFAGKTFQAEFEFDTKDDTDNLSEGVYIDDVTLLTGCT